MVKVKIVAVGKVKEKYFSLGIEEYAKRLKRFCQFSIVEVAEENYDKAQGKMLDVIKEKEAERILPNLKGFVFAMAIEGEKFSSENFAKKIKNLTDDGVGEITFVIGGSYGLSDKVKKKANKLISFSDMTFPHTLFRLMLCEQIYRAYTINEGTAYHK